MKLSIPLTGTLLSYNPPMGDHLDPVRPIPLDLGNVSWQLLALDLDHDLALIEITPADEGDFPTGELDKEGNQIYERRKLNESEKEDLLNNVKAMVLNKSMDELYQETNSQRLKKPALDNHDSVNER